MNRKIEKRPWGYFEQFTKNEKSTVKIITIFPEQELSLQYHRKRREFWRILDGRPEIIIGNKSFSAKAGDEFKVLKKQKHRLRAGSKTVKFLEISFGEFDEKDIMRLEDRYGRIKSKVKMN